MPPATSAAAGAGGGRSGVAWREAAVLVLHHPRLYATAVTQLLRLAPRGWWRRWPPIPEPAPAWRRFRQETQYGSADAPIDGHDIIDWLEWCRSERAARTTH